jgi:hypothetical protein
MANGPSGVVPRLAATMCAILALATPATSVSQDINWEIVDNGRACGAGRDGVLIGSPDGVKYGLIVQGVTVGEQALREIRLDERPFLLRFAQSGGSAFADLDASVMGALATSQVLTIRWSDRAVDVPLSSLMPALNKVQACGARLEIRRVAAVEAEQQAAQRRQRQRASIEGSGGIARQAPRSTMPHPGMTCMKRREWTSGFNKNCVYDCLGSEAVQTVGIAELCPLTMTR